MITTMIMIMLMTGIMMIMTMMMMLMTRMMMLMMMMMMMMMGTLEKSGVDPGSTQPPPEDWTSATVL